MAGTLRQLPSGGSNLRVYLGRDDRGKVVHKSRTFRGTRRDAERELARMVVEFEGSLESVRAEDAADPGRSIRWGPSTTINDTIEGWKLNGWDDLSPTTRRNYQALWDNHLRNSIGRKRLIHLTPWDVERYFRRLKDHSHPSQQSVTRVRALLHRACRLARKWSNAALPNPIADTELPEWGYGEQSPDVRSPSVEEVKAVLAAAELLDRRLAVFFRVSAATGARRGEVCALRWSDIDWKNSTIALDEAVVAFDGPAIVKGPKTRKSIRTVSIDEGTLEALRKYRAVKDAEADLCEVQVAEDGFIFSMHPAGISAPHPDPFTSGFRKAADSAKVPRDVHLHSLRHFQSTQLRRDIGSPKAGADGLDHSSNGPAIYGCCQRKRSTSRESHWRCARIGSRQAVGRLAPRTAVGRRRDPGHRQAQPPTAAFPLGSRLRRRAGGCSDPVHALSRTIRMAPVGQRRAMGAWLVTA